MTRLEAQALVTATFAEYVSLHTAKGIQPSEAASRLGVSRARYYQLKQGYSSMTLHLFLTLMAEVTRLKASNGASE